MAVRRADGHPLKDALVLGQTGQWETEFYMYARIFGTCLSV
jgi:hypothetical protein